MQAEKNNEHADSTIADLLSYIKELLIYITLNAGAPFSHVPASLMEGMVAWRSSA